MSNEVALAEAAREALVLLEAVVAGDLLAALPPDPEDRRRHQSAVDLVDLARARLAAALCTELDV